MLGQDTEEEAMDYERTKSEGPCAPDLRGCEGFAVAAPGGRIGYVEEVMATVVPDRSYMSVRAGRRGRLLLLVSATDVAEVCRGDSTVVLRRPTTARLVAA
jgi:hypothetical protein